MKIKSLLSLITLGVGVGALGLTSVVSSNAKNAANLKAEEATGETGPKVGDTEGWFLKGTTNGWTEANPFTFDKTGVYSTTIELNDKNNNGFKFFHKDPEIWINFSAIQNFRNIDPNIINVNGGGDSSITVEGSYKFSYVHSDYDYDAENKPRNKTAFWIEKVGEEVTGETIYLGTDLQIGEGESVTRVGGNYLYTWNDDGTQKYEQLGGFPGTPIEKLNRTGYFGTSSWLNFAENGGIYKIDTSLFPKANRFIMSYVENGEKKVQTKDIRHEVTGWKRYYSFFQTPASNGLVDGDESLYNAAELAFDLSKALEGTTFNVPGGENNSYYSVCNLTDKTQLKGLIDKYDALATEGKTAFDASTYWTYGSGEGMESTNDNIALAQLMNQININYAKTTNSVMFLGGNSSNNATLVVAGISAATIIASASMIILRRHKNKKA